MNCKRFFQRLLFPPVWLMVLLVILCAAGLAFVFVRGLAETIPAYVCFTLSFYTLCAVSAFSVLRLPPQLRRWRQKAHANPQMHRFLTDDKFHAQVSLYLALGVNLLYVAVNLLSHLLYRSMWFVVLAAYYAILAVMRFLLVRYVRVNPLGANHLGEVRRARLCAYLLLLINFALTGAVMMILFVNKGFTYHGVLIYVMAAYTFYSTAHAIVDLVKYRKYHSPVMTVSKIIALSAALWSMLALETAMFIQFGGEMTPENQRLMIILTGAGVSLATIAMSVFILVRTARERKGRKQHE